jgi:transposase
MPPVRRSRQQPTDDWQQLRLLVTSPEQETYELLRPIVLFGQPAADRARETGVPERTLRRKAARFASAGMQSLFDDPTPLAERDRRRLPAEIRRAIIALKAEYPPFSLREIARICRRRFGRPVDHQTVRQVLMAEPLPLNPPRRYQRYAAIPDPVQRRLAVVRLEREGWSTRSIAGHLDIARSLVYEILARWKTEGWPGLEDRLFGPRQPARKVDLKAMAIVRRLQANPELGEFRVHAALAQHGIDLSPRTCGRILAQHRAMGVAPRPASGTPAESQAMPFAAAYRHHYWSVDIRYIEDHALADPKPVSVISVLENYSRALLASVVSPRQDLTAYLIVLRAAIEAHGAPEVLVSDSGSVFLANQARTIYRALGIQKTEIERGQPWQNYIETHFNVMRRMADHDFARAATWASLRSIHERFFRDYNHQPHSAHTDRSKGRRSPASVLGWVHGAWCELAAIDRLFQLRARRVLNEHGSLRFRHWRLYGERGLAGKPAAVWLCGETLTIEYATEALAQYRVSLEEDEQRIRNASDPQLFVTGHASPQPFLSPLDEVEWRPAQRLAPYRPRRRRNGEGTQEPLFTVADVAALG